MRVSINKKIIGLFSIGFILFAFFGISAFFAIKAFYSNLQEAVAISRKINLTGNLQLKADRLLRPVNSYLITGDIKERDNFDSIINEMSRLFVELKSVRGDKKWQGVAENIEKDAIEFGEKAINILYIDNPIGNSEVQRLMYELHSMSDMLVREVDGFHRIAEDEIKTMEEDVKNRIRKNSIYALVILSVLLLSGLLLYYYLKIFVTLPIRQLHEEADIIATGNLAHRLDIRTGDELEDLAKEFNNMAASLGEAKKEIDRRIFELYTLYNVSKVLSTSFEMEELMKKIVDNVSKNLKIDRVMVMLVDDQNNELYIASYTDFVGDELIKKRFNLGEGLYGLAVVTGKPKLITDVEKDTAIAQEEKFNADINSIITVPFGVRGKILGLLNVFKNKPDFFEEEDVELLMAVAEHVALALENAKLYKETKLLAITDGLTGLYNHRFFIEKLKAEISRSRRYRHRLSLIMIDIDYFKRYNDTHGHQMGDALLRQIADLLKNSLRNTDFIARYGGEEFVIILLDTNKDSAIQTAERIRKAVEEYHFPRQDTQPEGNLTISLGVASLDIDATDADGLVKKADDALYKAKESGRNKVVSA